MTKQRVIAVCLEYPKKIQKLVRNMLCGTSQKMLLEGARNPLGIQARGEGLSLFRGHHDGGSSRFQGLAALCLSLSLVVFLPACKVDPPEEAATPIVVGVDGSTQVIAFETEGGNPLATISQQTLGFPIYGAAHNNDGYWVLAGAGGNVLGSSNPLDQNSWVTSNVGSDVNLRAVAYGNGQWVAVGDRDAIYYVQTERISDTTAWTAVSPPVDAALDITSRGLTVDGEAYYSFRSAGFDGENWLVGVTTATAVGVTAGEATNESASDSRLTRFTVTGGTLMPTAFDSRYTSYFIERDMNTSSLTLTATKPPSAASTVECTTERFTPGSGMNGGLLNPGSLADITPEPVVATTGNNTTCTISGLTNSNNQAHRVSITVTSENTLFDTTYSFYVLGSALHTATSNEYTSNLSDLVVQVNAGNASATCTGTPLQLNRVLADRTAGMDFDADTDQYYVTLPSSTGAVKICTKITGNTSATVRAFINNSLVDATNGNVVIEELDSDGKSMREIDIHVNSAQNYTNPLTDRSSFTSRGYTIHLLDDGATPPTTITNRTTGSTRNVVPYGGEFWSATDPTEIYEVDNPHTSGGWSRITRTNAPILDMVYTGENWLLAGNNNAVGNVYTSLTFPITNVTYMPGVGAIIFPYVYGTSLGIAYGDEKAVIAGQFILNKQRGGSVLYDVPSDDPATLRTELYRHLQSGAGTAPSALRTSTDFPYYNYDRGVQEYSDAVFSEGKWFFGGTDKNNLNRVLLIVPIVDERTDLSGDLIDLQAPEGGLPSFPNLLRLVGGVRK